MRWFAVAIVLAAAPGAVQGARAQSAKPYVDVTFLIDNSESMMIASTSAGVTALQPATAATSCFQATTLDDGKSTYTGSVNRTTGLPIPPYGTATTYCDSGTIGAYTCTQGSPPIASMSNPQYGIETFQGCQCAFACHWVSPTVGNTFTSGGKVYSLDYYGVARSLGVQLRFDVVQSAVATAIGYLAANEAVPGQFGASVYAYSTGLTQVWPPPGDSPAQAMKDMTCLDATKHRCTGNALAATHSVTPPLTDDMADANFPSAMTGLTAAASPSGDGGNPRRARKALIIITDGIQDWGGRAIVPGYSLAAGDAANPNGAEGPISPHDCDAIKTLGYSVYVLYTTYLTSPTSLVIYNEELVPYINGVTGTPYDLPTNLMGCASSPANFLQASEPAEIQSALQSLAAAAAKAPTQE